MASRFGNPFWSLEESFTIPFTGITFQTKVGQEMEHAKRTMFNFCDSVISQKKEQTEVCEKEKPDEMDPERKGQKDLLSLYMDIKDANGERLSQEQLKEIILNLIIAGR
jgi:cytochrome P450